MIKKIILILLLVCTPVYAQWGNSSPFPAGLIMRDDGVLVDGNGRILDLRENLSVTFDSLTGAYHLAATSGSGAEVNNLETITTDIEDDEVPVGTGSDTAAYITIPNCNSATEKLIYTQATNLFSCETDADSGGATAWDDIGDPTSSGNILFTPYPQTVTGTLTVDGTLLVAGTLDASGNIEGATITESGEDVYNATEVPGGELGGTFASFTIDDNLTVEGWTLNSITLGGTTTLGGSLSLSGTLQVDGNIDSDSTINGAVMTEGGNALYNATETPGGELGGTFASFTIDDNLTVEGWTLNSITLGGTTTAGGSLTLSGTLNVEGIINTGTSHIAITNAVGNLDGDQIEDDTIDDDSIDFSDVTCADITATDCGAITSSAAVNFSGGTLEIPQGLDQIAATAGLLQLDTTITGYARGAIVFHDGTSVRHIVDLDTVPSSDDFVIAYDADADKFYMATVGGEVSGTLPNITIDDSLTVEAWTLNSITIGGTTTVSGSIDVSGTLGVSGLVSCDTIDTDANGLMSCGTDGGSGFSMQLDPKSAKLPASNPMGIDAGNLQWRGLFDDTTDECARWQGVLTPYTSGLDIDITYSLETTSTSDVVELEVYIMCGKSNADMDIDRFDTVNNLSSGSVSTTAGYQAKLAATLSNIDSCAEDDTIIVKICRDADSTDTTADDVEYRGAVLHE